jgi:predicted nucleic acid-binding protein
MILADSNIIIYVTSGQYPELTNWFLDNAPSVSAVSMVEVLGYHNLKSSEKAELERFFSRLNVLYPTAEEFHEAIGLRQRRVISLGDALVAATALNQGLILATHNTKDFVWIKTLDVIDPMAG